MKTKFLLFSFLVFALGTKAQLSPAITSWLQNTTITGTYYVSGNSTAIDNNILVLLKERFEIVKKIKEIKIKIKNKIEILDKEREKKIYDNIYNNFNEYYIYFKPIFEIILKESKIYQSNRITITDL